MFDSYLVERFETMNYPEQILVLLEYTKPPRAVGRV